MARTNRLPAQSDRRAGSARLGQPFVGVDYLRTGRNIAAISRLLVLMIISGCVDSNVGKSPSIPEALRVPADLALILEVQASGVQIYECQASKDALPGFRWIFQAPEAELRDRAGSVVGRHYAGPTWEANDGSKVVGEVVARDSSADPNAIPWLLLRVTAASDRGLFSHIKSIQRIDTSGGNAPMDGCSEALVGKETRVPYKAKYLFYGSRQ
jgi:hypothetical protein